MGRIAIIVCVIFCAGCSRTPDTDAEFIEGGTARNVDRDKCQEYFSALVNVQSAGEEKKILAEFGEWLKKKRYKIRVEVKNGKHMLSCPYFPPDTPWISHSFIDVKNLELLPRLDNGR